MKDTMTHTRNTLMTLAAALALTAGFAKATENESSVAAHIEQISQEARNVEREANEISDMLRGKNPDFSLVNEKMEVLDKHVAAVRDHINKFEASSPELTATEKAAFEKMKTAAAVNEIFVANKKNLLNSDDKAKQRKVLRAKAEGIAHRARLVQQSAVKFRS